MTATNIIAGSLELLGAGTLCYVIARLHVGAYIVLQHKRQRAWRTRRRAERNRRKKFIDFMEAGEKE